MQTSVFLAKLIGPVAFLMGLVVLLDPQRVRTLAREALQGEAIIFIAGLIALTVGLAIVNTHNVWSADWRVVITILGWLMVLGGIARIGFSRQVKAMGAAMLNRQWLLRLPGGLMVTLGFWLFWMGYVA